MLEGFVENFHFLRPLWLAGIPVALLLHRRLAGRQSARLRWRDVIDPHLLDPLVSSGERGPRLRPYQAMTALLVLASLAMAGPAWRREITPFTEDTAPLVVALELTPGMMAVDQPPTRLERAKQKLRDLLEARPGARTAVVVYAGSAHTVLPLTDDPGLVEAYLDSLAPSLMPEAGDRPDRALALALRIMEREPTPGTVVFLCDGVDRASVGAFAEARSASDVQVLFLALGTAGGGPMRAEPGDTRAPGVAPGVDRAGIAAAADAAGGSFTEAQVDDGDVRWLARRIRVHLIDRSNEDDSLRWQDAGYALVWPVAGLALLWFRRGWTVRWV